MTTKFEILDWDSKHFGYKVASINSTCADQREVSDLFRRLASQGIKLAYWFIAPSNKDLNKMAVLNGGVLVDEKTVYVKKIPQNISSGNQPNIKSVFGEKLNSKLKFLSLEAGTFSRYKVDTNFRRSEFEKLYTEWIKKSLSGAIAQDVLVYIRRKNIIGLVTLGEKNGCANIGLIAVDPGFRGQGVGRGLINAVSVRARQIGYKKLNVVTQKANIGACKFYEAYGFKVKSVVNIYHFWI